MPGPATLPLQICYTHPMALAKKTLKQLRDRDDHCWHCGAEGELLVPHHRKNRQAGGSKNRENDITNLMMICAGWNGRIESSAEHAAAARSVGHKLRSWQDTWNPVYDFQDGRWYRLEQDGTKTETTDEVPF